MAASPPGWSRPAGAALNLPSARGPARRSQRRPGARATSPVAGRCGRGAGRRSPDVLAGGLRWRRGGSAAGHSGAGCRRSHAVRGPRADRVGTGVGGDREEHDREGSSADSTTEKKVKIPDQGPRHVHRALGGRPEGGRGWRPTAALCGHGGEEPPVRRRRDRARHPDDPDRPAQLDRRRRLAIGAGQRPGQGGLHRLPGHPGHRRPLLLAAADLRAGVVPGRQPGDAERLALGARAPTPSATMSVPTGSIWSTTRSGTGSATATWAARQRESGHR